MTTTSADITVVIPAYNAGPFIAEAIDSVLGQELQPAEIIVVDDGSVDGTSEIVRRFPEVTYHHQQNAGAAAARNVGLALATGSFVAFHDADDLMTPNRLGDQLRYLAQNPDVDAVLGRYENHVVDGGHVPEWASYGDPSEAGVSLDGALMARTGSMRRVGGFDETIALAEGIDLLARFKEMGLSFGILDRVIIIRRIHGANISSDTRTAARGFAVAIHSHLKRKREG
jgi:glycosyltransferase involved in cell wall biosynthesis